MVKHQTTVICDFCKSKNVSYQEVRDPISYRRVTDSSFDHQLTEPSRYRVTLECTCNNCGKSFTKKLGEEDIPLCPGYFEV